METCWGGFNFNHRVGAGFDNEQWGGARGIMDDVLPEVAAWNAIPRIKRDVENRVTNVVKDIHRPLTEWSSTLPLRLPRYDYWTNKPELNYTWPAQEESSFVRNFADELIAVKRAGYYATIFVGHPAKHTQYIDARENLRWPLADDAENQGQSVNARRITPFLGGGLSSFWTPAYGTAVLGTNWTPLAQNGLVATKADGSRWWADYFSTSFQLDEEEDSLVVAGQIEKLPLRYERQYLFGPDRLSVTLTVTANEDVSVESLVEVIPIPLGSVKANGASMAVVPAVDDASLVASITTTDLSGVGVEFALETPGRVTLQTNGLKQRSLQIGRAEVAFPATLKAGESATLSYTIRGIPDATLANSLGKPPPLD